MSLRKFIAALVFSSLVLSSLAWSSARADDKVLKVGSTPTGIPFTFLDTKTNTIEGVMVEYYGTRTPLNQLAALSAPEPRLLLVQPYDRSIMSAVEKAIYQSDLGLTPVNDGKVIRVPIPELTEERRTNAENLSGTGIEGGVTGRVSRGDWILVPAGEPHQFPAVEASGLRLMSLHLPKKIN